MKESMDATAMEGAAYNKSNSSDQFGPPAGVLVKGKRTKRQRTVIVGPASSSASSTEVTGSSTTEEEEDMAHCLILLAQGRALDLGLEDHLKTVAAEEETGAGEKPTGRKAGDYVYECKTCRKCFPSFQALGGHRTSHKKPKMAILAETKRPVAEQDVGPQIAANSSIPKPIAPTPSKPRMHECMICGSEFSSGQALGGHMRRHRPLTPAEPAEVKKDKAVFVLDLNLPAPPDVDIEELPMSPAAAAAAASMAFPFESQQSLVF